MVCASSQTEIIWMNHQTFYFDGAIQELFPVCFRRRKSAIFLRYHKSAILAEAAWDLWTCDLGENCQSSGCKTGRLGQEGARSWKNFSILQRALYFIMFFLASAKTDYFGIVIREKAKFLSASNGEQGNIIFFFPNSIENLFNST